jgi:cyclopropane fatty-acyl-phospholipid synthase-like methyltransferase
LLTRDSSILDLGGGNDVPTSSALIEDGFLVHGVDASATTTAAFRVGFPQAHVAGEAVERSRFFSRTFDGVVAWGLMFLLSAEVQRVLIRGVAAALNPGGRFLFTSPAQASAWADSLDAALGRRSIWQRSRRKLH